MEQLQLNDYEKPYRRWTDKEFKQFQKNINMETKKKINWLRIWQIIRDILVTLLTTDAIVNKV